LCRWAPSSPERLWRNHHYGGDSQRPRSKTPLLGRKQTIISLSGRKPIYVISGRKPIFSVEKSLDFTIKVENNYVLVSGLASCRILWQPETDCQIERPSAVRHCGHTQETFLEDRQRRRFMRFRHGRCLRYYPLLSRSSQAVPRLSTGLSGPFVRRALRNRAQYKRSETK